MIATCYSSFFRLPLRPVLLWLVLLAAGSATAQNGPVVTNFTNSLNTLGSRNVNGVFAVGNTVYAATNNGLGISANGGQTFVNITNHLGSVTVTGVFVAGNTVYAATTGGLGISTDGGQNFTTNTSNGLTSNRLWGVYATGSSVYAATENGVGISTNGGANFTSSTSGLGDAFVNGVFAVGSTVYAATAGGLSISTNGGASFINKTTADGLGDNVVYGVYAAGSKVYAATSNGVSISTDGGASFSTVRSGLGSRITLGIYAIGNTVYVATYGGLSISANGGATFANSTTANGLGDDIVFGTHATLTAVYAATYGGLTFGAGAATPVTLRYFNGRMTDAGALLGWATAREENNAHFQIERSRNAVGFESIATVPSLAVDGNSITELTYSYLDTQPLPGVNYYRLIQTDRDGTVTRHNIISLAREGAVPVLFPNPVSVAGEASVEPPIAYDRYELTDSQGKTVQQATQPGVLSRVSLTGLPAGVYLLRVQTQDGAKTWRVVR